MSNVDVEFYDHIFYTFMGPDGEGGQYLIKKALQVTNQAKRNCPVDTGRLRDSITWEIGAFGPLMQVRVGSNVEYAAFVELGTRYMTPRSFLRNALYSVLGTT